MKNLLFILILLVLAGCEQEYQYHSEIVIPDSNKTKYTEFVTKTISSASLHMTGGDYEDPEDLVRAADYMATNLYGVKQEGLYKTTNNGWIFIPYDSLTTEQKLIFKRIKHGQ